MNIQRVTEICRLLKDKGFSTTNICFGLGSWNYRMQTRDTLGMAMKTTWGTKYIEGEIVEEMLFKDPITDKDSFKKSHKGIVKVVQGDDGNWSWTDGYLDSDLNGTRGDMVVLFENGELKHFSTFDEIRERLSKVTSLE